MTKNPCWLIAVAAVMIGTLHGTPTSYNRTADGVLAPAALKFLNGKSPSSRDRYPLANGGLFSTAGDCAKFAQMILRRAFQETAAQP